MLIEAQRYLQKNAWRTKKTWRHVNTLSIWKKWFPICKNLKQTLDDYTVYVSGHVSRMPTADTTLPLGAQRKDCWWGITIQVKSCSWKKSSFIRLWEVQRTETGIKFSKDLWIHSYSVVWSGSECFVFVFMYLESGLVSLIIHSDVYGTSSVDQARASGSIKGLPYGYQSQFWRTRKLPNPRRQKWKSRNSLQTSLKRLLSLFSLTTLFF